MMKPRKQGQHAADCGDLQYWIAEWFKGTKRESTHTREAYRRDLNQFLDQCARPFDLVTIGDLLDYQSHLNSQKEAGKMAVKTVARKIASLRSFYRFMNRHEITALNLEKIETGKILASVDHDKLLTVAEVEAIIEAATDPTHRLFVRLLYLTAARVSEALGLRWRDMTPLDDGGQAHVTGKGRKPRKVFLPPALWADLLAARDGAANADLLFPAINRMKAFEIVRKLGKAAGIDKPVSPHSLRHAHLSHALEAGATLAELRDQAGHANISTTSLYLGANSKRSSARLLRVQ